MLNTEGILKHAVQTSNDYCSFLLHFIFFLSKIIRYGSDCNDNELARSLWGDIKTFCARPDHCSPR
jgi:hypothetical protein